MSKDKTNQKGITLIALVITIIVMLILVGVSVTVALNGGLFNTAKQATNKTQLELDKEQLLSAAIGAIGEDGKVDLSKLQLPEGFTESDGVYTSKSGNKFTISDYGSVTEVTEGGSDQQPGDGNGAEGETPGDENPTNPSEPTEPENPSEPTKVTITPKKETYTVGEEVTIGEENFYVIADDADKVTLLAKDCIDTTTLEQSSSPNRISFSTKRYWGSGNIIEPEPTLDETTGKLTLPDSHTVAKAAYDYGRELGGTGRLMTHSEATALETANSDILYSPDGMSPNSYWLGSAYNAANVWIVHITDDCIYCDVEYSYASVRPVVEISKSNIS